MVKQGKKAGTNFAVRGEPDARAVSAERMRDRSDNADFTFAIVESIAPRSFAKFIGELAHGTKLVELFQNFIHWDNYVRRPDAVFFERHEFDKAHDYAFFAGKA